jgi:hypothetical protein
MENGDHEYQAEEVCNNYWMSDIFTRPTPVPNSKEQELKLLAHILLSDDSKESMFQHPTSNIQHPASNMFQHLPAVMDENDLLIVPNMLDCE